MRTMLEKSKNITYIDATVTIRSALNEQNRADIECMAKELCR